LLWFLVALGLVATVVIVRDLLRRPDPTALPEPLRSPPRGGDHADWARTWAGPDGGGTGSGQT
jgi:hypothetical protein